MAYRLSAYRFSVDLRDAGLARRKPRGPAGESRECDEGDEMHAAVQNHGGRNQAVWVANRYLSNGLAVDACEISLV